MDGDPEIRKRHNACRKVLGLVGALPQEIQLFFNKDYSLAVLRYRGYTFHVGTNNVDSETIDQVLIWRDVVDKMYRDGGDNMDPNDRPTAEEVRKSTEKVIQDSKDKQEEVTRRNEGRKR